LVGALGEDRLEEPAEAAGRQSRSLGAAARREPAPRRRLAQGARPQRRPVERAGGPARARSDPDALSGRAVLHVLNGDATHRVFEQTHLTGDVLVWRDILVEGPAASPDERAPWLAARLGINAEEYVRGRREEAAALAATARHDEVVLWFEHDLFCAVNLWFLLDRFSARGGGPVDFSRLFAMVGAREPVRPHGMGDLQFAARLRELSRGPHALVTLDADGRAPRAWTLALTPLGRDVVAGRADWLAHHPLDRWLGGVHLHSPRPSWRWDGRARRLVLA